MIDLAPIYRKFKRRCPCGVLNIIFMSPRSGRLDWNVNANPSSGGYTANTVSICFKGYKDLALILNKYFDMNLVDW